MAETVLKRSKSRTPNEEAGGETSEGAQRRRNQSRSASLAKPKMSKADWQTSYEQKLVWGNQEPMWPLNPAAMKAVASERIETLARSKTNLQANYPEKCSRPEFQYSCGRSSVIWDVSPNATKGSPSERIELLSRHKTLPAGYREDRPGYPMGCGRSSPIWEVSDKAKNAAEKPESVRLAEPKRTHPNYIPCRDVQWPVSETARRGGASTRTELLARPKDRTERHIRDPIWLVKKSTLSAGASARVQELSKPKQLPEGFVSNRDVEWRVPRTTLKSYTTERTKILSQPIVRDAMDHVQFNPDAFRVRESAKRAKISSRVNDLAQPIQRGARIKAS